MTPGNGTLHVFDLDHTLAIPDKETDERCYYFTVHHLQPIPEMVQIFSDALEKVILTNRHPALQRELEHIWGCPVHCRDYSLSWAVIQEINSNVYLYEEFMGRMVTWKTRKLNEWARQYDRVVFYEDQIARFRQADLRRNVHIIDPWPIYASPETPREVRPRQQPTTSP